MRYTVYHLTHFRYDAPVSESVMEVRMQPRTESVQRCLRFELATTPRARVFAYQDPEGNVVHHFDVPARHRELTIVAESVVEFVADIAIPERGEMAMWGVLDERATRERFFEFLEPSYFARPTEALTAFGRELGLSREIDPLSLVRRLKHQLYDAFEYAPQSTRVDSPIDDALAARRGVCQDFAHVMIALVRGMGIPCRYVSGYLFHSHNGDERSVDGASHAWIEACLPSLGYKFSKFARRNMRALVTATTNRLSIAWSILVRSDALQARARLPAGKAVY